MNKVLNKVQITFQEALNRVKKGAGWLDETQPAWRMKIQAEKFDIRSCDNCILGQVIGDFWESGLQVTRARDMGFYLMNDMDLGADCDESTTDNWNLLQEAWEHVLR